MAPVTDHGKTLKLISQAWGRQKGYCFFPWIDRQRQQETGLRREGYNEGPAFEWPKDRDKILEHLAAHEDHDLYWCPSLFEYPMRRQDVAMDECALWADLDEADPRQFEDSLKPTVAWETSLGRFQALWLAAAGDFQGASWPGNENQRLTYAVGADPSGWDTVQLLRVPGWVNHKPDRDGERGRLLWTDGPRYVQGDFDELPEIKGVQGTALSEALEAEIEGVDRHKVIARVQLKLTHKARELLHAKGLTGDRSEQQWYLTRCLADVGCTVTEMVAIIHALPWNKFADRTDEMRVLISEASKAIALKRDKPETEDYEDVERPPLQRLGALLKNVKRPEFIVRDVLTLGACGFIAGTPKTYKSWSALDMALSIATGADFLGHFPVVNPGPVLYIQEEDPAPTVKTRSAKIWTGKGVDKLVMDEDGVMWLPPETEKEFDPDVAGYIQHGFTISDSAWLLWLDEQLAEGLDAQQYKALFIDTFGMTAGDVDDNKSQELNARVLKPLKTLSRKHEVAILLVHHLGKADRERSGSRLLGSTALHAWGEDSIYMLGGGVGKDVKMETESKSFPASQWRISNLNNLTWEPQVSPWAKPEGEESWQSQSRRSNGGYKRVSASPRRRRPPSTPKALEALADRTTATTRELAEAAGLSYQQAHRQMIRASEQGHVLRQGSQWTIAAT